MKAFLISDHAKWCALMMNGKKKLEVRKGTALYKAIQKLINEYGYAEFYVYCTKANKYDELLVNNTDTKEIFLNKSKAFYLDDWNRFTHLQILNGKVIFKFRCYKVEEIFVDEENNDYFYKTKRLTNKKLQNKSCLSNRELVDYLNLEEGTAVHISDLEIFDKPKELSEFGCDYCEYKSRCDNCPYYYRDGLEHLCQMADLKGYCPITKAPQSFAYIEVGE